MKAGPLIVGAVVALGLLSGLVLVCGAGTPARGQVFSIEVLPATAVNIVGTEHTVTASVSQDGTPAGGSYTFEIIAGPNAGKTGHGPSFTYTGDGGPGTDTIKGCFLSEFCGTATKTWVEPSPSPKPSPSPPAVPASSPTASPPLVLPPTGGAKADGSGLPLRVVAAAIAVAGLPLLAAGALAKPAGKRRG